MAFTISSDLAYAVNRSQLLTPSWSSSTRTGPGAGLTTAPERSDSYDWKASTLATLRAQQSATQTDESAGLSAEETAILLRNQILNDITTALRAQVNVTQLPLTLLR